MAEAEQPRIDDLKRLLKRLEQAGPEADVPKPPPLPKIAVTESKDATAKNNGEAAPRADAKAAPAPAATDANAPRPVLPWLAAGAGTAALAVALLAGLQSDKVGSTAGKTAAPRVETTKVETKPRPAPIETAATSTAARPPADTTATKPEAPTGATSAAPPAPTVATPPQGAIAAPAAEPPPPSATPAPAAAEAPPASAGPLPESPTMRAAAPTAGRDKYESEARLDAYLERGQKLLDDGDLTAARSFFRRVAESGDPRGALALGATYDSNYSGQLGIRTAQPDNTVAGEWYRRAMELGSKDAMDRLEKLEK